MSRRALWYLVAAAALVAAVGLFAIGSPIFGALFMALALTALVLAPRRPRR